MTGEGAKPESEAVTQARARAVRLASAFEEVFGQQRARTASQRLVLEHLSACSGGDGNDYRFGESKDGLTLIAGGIHRDGARSVLRIIERQLAIAMKSGEPRRVKPKTIK